MQSFSLLCALVLLQQVLETPSFLGDAKIQSPQEVGLQTGSVKLALSLQVCDHTQQLCSQMIKGLGPYEVALDLAPHTPIKDIEVWTGSGPTYLLDLCQSAHGLLRTMTGRPVLLPVDVGIICIPCSMQVPLIQKREVLFAVDFGPLRYLVYCAQAVTKAELHPDHQARILLAS